MSRRLNSTPVHTIDDKAVIADYFHEESIIRSSSFDEPEDKGKSEKAKPDVRGKSPVNFKNLDASNKTNKNVFSPQTKSSDHKNKLEKQSDTQTPALTLQLNLTFPRRKVKDSKKTELEKNLDALFSGKTHVVHECLCIPREGTNILNCECKPVEKPTSTPLLTPTSNLTSSYYQPPVQQAVQPVQQHVVQDSSVHGGRYANQTAGLENLMNNEPCDSKCPNCNPKEKTFSAKENYQCSQRYPCSIANKYNYCSNYAQNFQNNTETTEEEFYVNPDPSFLHRNYNINETYTPDSIHCGFTGQVQPPNNYTTTYDSNAFSHYEPNCNTSFPEKNVTKKDKSTATEMKYLMIPNTGLLPSNPCASPQNPGLLSANTCVPPQNTGLLPSSPCAPPQNPGLLSSNSGSSPQNAANPCGSSQNPILISNSFTYEVDTLTDCELQEYPSIEEECESSIVDQENFGYSSEEYDVCSDVNGQNYYYPPYGNF